MKNTIKVFSPFLLIFFLIGSLTCKKDPSIEDAINIPNGDFENWNWEPLPENWKTNSCPLCTTPWEMYVAQKDSEVVFHGKYSMKLIYNLTLPIPIYRWSPTWIKNKFAISKHPSNLHGYVKCNIHGIDTVYIGIMLLNKGIVVDSGQWNSTLSISNWTLVNIPISSSSSAVDSALITIIGGKFKDSTTSLTNSTAFWVDNLTLN